jgi:hypothetical protein
MHIQANDIGYMSTFKLESFINSHCGKRNGKTSHKI